MRRPYFVPHRVLAARFALSAEPEDETEIKSLSLTVDPSLIRAVSLRDVLSCGGHVLNHSAGSQATFKKSMQVENINVFICHSWDTRRPSKFAALSMYSRTYQGLISYVLVIISMMLLDVFEKLPTWNRQRGNITVEMSPWCGIFACPLYWALVLSYYDLSPFFGRNVFLDKMCIDQEDEVRRTQGINAIPAIIAKSQSMVVILTPSALSKVWTMFEMSAFLIIHGPKHLFVQPALQAKVCVFSSFFVYGCGLCFIGVNSIPSEGLLVWLRLLLMFVTLTAGCCCIWYLFKWGLIIQRLQQQAESFNFDTAVCAFEEDRLMLKNMVMQLFFDDVIQDHEIETKLVRIQQLQQQLQIVVADTIRKALGRTGIPFRFLFCVNVALVALECDSLSTDFRYVRLGLAPRFIAGQSVLRSLVDVTCYFALQSIICYLCVYEVHQECRISCYWFSHIKRWGIFVMGASLFPLTAILSQFTAQLLLSGESAGTITLVSLSILCMLNVLVICFFHLQCCNTRGCLDSDSSLHLTEGSGNKI